MDVKRSAVGSALIATVAVSTLATALEISVG
jgi:hypothetical protein